jgi:hypothetical protein
MKINNYAKIVKPAKRNLEVGQVWLDITTGTPYMITPGYGLVSLITGYYYDVGDCDEMWMIFAGDDNDFVQVEAEVNVLNVIN